MKGLGDELTDRPINRTIDQIAVIRSACRNCGCNWEWFTKEGRCDMKMQLLRITTVSLLLAPFYAGPWESSIKSYPSAYSSQKNLQN